MGTGDRLVTDGEYLAGAACLTQLGGQMQRLGGGGGVGCAALPMRTIPE